MAVRVASEWPATEVNTTPKSSEPKFTTIKNMASEKPPDTVVNAPWSGEAEPDFGVKRHRDRRIRPGLDDFDRVAESAEHPGGHVQGPDDPVHLRMPGVGCDQDSGHAASFEFLAPRIKVEMRGCLQTRTRVRSANSSGP